METSSSNQQSNKEQQQQQQTPNNQQATSVYHYQNKETESLLESNWISIKDRETAVLEFLTGVGKIKVVEKPDFSGKLANRVQFAVIDINDPQRREKTFELGKIHVEKIYAELQSKPKFATFY